MSLAQETGIPCGYSALIPAGRGSVFIVSGFIPILAVQGVCLWTLTFLVPAQDSWSRVGALQDHSPLIF